MPTDRIASRLVTLALWFVALLTLALVVGVLAEREVARYEAATQERAR